VWHATRILSFLALLLLVVTDATAFDAIGELQGDVLWQGEVRLLGPVTIVSGGGLTISAGTVVRPIAADAQLVVSGRLLVLGRPEAPVLFAADKNGWRGVTFDSGKGDSRIEHAIFSHAEVAISSTSTSFTLRNCSFRDGGTAVSLLREAHPLIEECLFVNNRVGIDSEMKSAAMIRHNRFAGQTEAAIRLGRNSSGGVVENTFEKNAQGVVVLQQYPSVIRGNRFINNETGIYCTQTQQTPQIVGNYFEANHRALANFSFASPHVEDNTFVTNEVAIHNDQFSAPSVSHNLFRNNRMALYNYRKSSPLIERNQIEANDTAVFCDYSSYPRLQFNNFRDNRMAVDLGKFQSGEWEKIYGAQVAEQMATRSAKGRNPQAAQSGKILDVIDVSNNWWGPDTAEMAQEGAEGNLTIFHDRCDQPRVFYDGYAANGYVFDLVRFSPWLQAPVDDSGPRRLPAQAAIRQEQERN